MKALLILFICLSAMNLTEAAEWKLNSDTLICQTREQFVAQMKAIDEENHTFAPGCGSTDKNYNVEILDLHPTSASKVRLLETGAVIWAMSNGLSH